MKNKDNYPYWVNDETSTRLYEAFLRIKTLSPTSVSVERPLSYASIAEEAGFQRSVLKPDKFPELRSLIEDEKSNPSKGFSISDQLKQKVKANKNLRLRLKKETEYAQKCANQYINSEQEIIRLKEKIHSLEGKLIKYNNILHIK